MCLGFADSPLDFFEFQPEVLGRVREGRRGLTGRFPASGSPAARGSGRKARGGPGAPLGGLGAARGGLWRRLRVTRRSAAVGVSGGDAPVKDWRKERVGELRGGEAMLARGSERAEERR